MDSNTAWPSASVLGVMPRPGERRVESSSPIEVVVNNGSATTVDQSSVKLTLNGEDVAADVSRSGDIVTISYTGGLAAEANTATVSFKESNGIERSAEWSFEVKVTKPGEAGTLTDGLIGYWPLDEGDGTTAANAAGGADAELYDGVEWIDDPERGMVLSFDGVDGYADAGAETIPQMTQDNDFTWSVWINQGSGNGPNNVVLGNRYSPGGGDFAPREFIKFTPTQFEFHRDGAGQNCDYDDLANSEGEWVHYVVVKTGNTLTHYSNGEEGESSTFTSELQNPQPFYFGGDQTNENWIGMLDDIAIWDRSISEEEVALIYNDGEGTAPVSQNPEDAIPYVKRLTAGPGGFGFMVADELAVEVDVDSIVVTVDGADVAVAKSKEDGLTSIQYTAAQLFAPNTEHIMTFSYVDTDGNARNLEKGFQVRDYSMVDAGLMVDSSLKGESGFIANITQISTGQSGRESMHANRSANAERQLNGEYIDPDFEEAYLNEADLDADMGWSYYRSEERRVGKECRSRWSPYH